MRDHDSELSKAFDGQAERFERAPVQSDPMALRRLVSFADLPEGSRVLDAGCGPGLVSEAFLDAGYLVYGVDLSAEMIARARRRCDRHGDRARFEQTSVFDAALEGPFDASVSRHVLHHMVDPAAFVRRQIELLRSGGILVISDHSTDPDPSRAAHHERIERERDTTHTRNSTAGTLVDLLASAGLTRVSMLEESFTLDFDEWFDRGTPGAPKAEVRARLLAGPRIRGFAASVTGDSAVQIDCVRALVRGVKAG
jgi:2-polyprenyl-3-methyl-5-hydroxy-6-metoxy-1,4-benzoquinol methylase